MSLCRCVAVICSLVRMRYPESFAALSSRDNKMGQSLKAAKHHSEVAIWLAYLSSLSSCTSGGAIVCLQAAHNSGSNKT